MPLPLLFPVLATLALAVAGSEEEEDPSVWKIEIEEEDFKLVNDSKPGYVDIDLPERRVTSGVLTYYENKNPSGDGVVRMRFTEAYKGGEFAEFFRSPHTISLLEEMRGDFLVGTKGWDDIESLVMAFYEDEPGQYMSPSGLMRKDVDGDGHAELQVLLQILEDGRRYFRWRGRGNIAVGGEDDEDEAVSELLFDFIRAQLIGYPNRWETDTIDRRELGIGVETVTEETSDLRRLLDMPTWGFEIRLEPTEDDPGDPDSLLYTPVGETELMEIIRVLKLEEIPAPDGWNRAYVFWAPNDAEEPPLTW